MIDTSSSVVIAVPGVISVPALTCRNPKTPVNGAWIRPIVEPGDHGLVACHRPGQTSARLVDVGNGHAALFKKVAKAVMLPTHVPDIGLGLGEKRGLLLVGQFDQHGAFFDEVPVLETHLANRVGDLGRDGDGFVGLGRANRFNQVGNRADHRRPGGDQGCRAPASGTAPRTAWAARTIAAVAASNEQKESNYHSERAGRTTPPENTVPLYFTRIALLFPSLRALRRQWATSCRALGDLERQGVVA